MATRRDFVRLAAGMVVALPLAAQALPRDGIRRIGVLLGITANAFELNEVARLDSSISSRRPIFGPMDLKDAAAVAKDHICDLFVVDAPQNVRLEGFLYDDHLGVWSCTIGFTRADGEKSVPVSKIVRVSEANKSVLSVRDP